MKSKQQKGTNMQKSTVTTKYYDETTGECLRQTVTVYVGDQIIEETETVYESDETPKPKRAGWSKERKAKYKATITAKQKEINAAWAEHKKA